MTIGQNWPRSGCTALYHLPDVNDSSGNSYTLTNTGTVTFGAGKFGNCADFGVAGGTILLRRTDTVGLNLANPFTVNFWFVVAQQPGTDEMQRLIYISTDTADRHEVDYRDDTGTKKISSYSSGTDTSYTITLTTGAWYMGTLVSDGTNLAFYLNGNQIITGVTGSPNGSATFVYIGGENGQTRSLRGKMDEVDFISRAWSAGEIRRWYAWCTGKLL